MHGVLKESIELHLDVALQCLRSLVAPYCRLDVAPGEGKAFPLTLLVTLYIAFL